MTLSVSAQCRSCIAILQEVISASPQPDRNGKNSRNLRMREELDRLSLFVGNIGALHQPESPMSIESRLQGAHDVLTHIVGLLDDLKEVTGELLDIVSGKREGMVSVAEETDDECGGEISEVNELQEEISGTVTQLFRISTLIRRAAPTDVFVKALSRNRYSFNDQFGISHVGEKHPKLATKDSAWLCQRLGRAITQRRHYLSYIQDHREKLAGPLNYHEHPGGLAYKPQIPNIKQSLRSKPTLDRESLPSFFTKATTIAAERLAPQLNAADESDSDDACSYTTISGSIDGDHESSTNVRIPKLDSLRTGHGKEFECPFCFRIKKFKSERMWKKHVFSDLRPYVCTFPDCDAPYFGDINKWFQHEMMFHRVNYKCFLCAKVFNQEGKYISHLGREHEEVLYNGGKQTVIDLSRKPLAQIPATDCPCCFDWSARLEEQATQTSGLVPAGILAVTPTVFKRHLAGHLEKLAPFAIPIGASTDANNDSNAAMEETKSKRTFASKLSALIFSSDRDDLERSIQEKEVDESGDLLHADTQLLEIEADSGIEHQDSILSDPAVENALEEVKYSDRLTNWAALAETLIYSGAWGDVERLYAHLVVTSMEIFGPGHYNTVRSESEQETAYQKYIDFWGAEEGRLRTLGRNMIVLDTEPWAGLFGLKSVADLLYEQERYGEAEILYRPALGIQETLVDDEHEERISTIKQLAHVKERLGKSAEAENLYKRCLEWRKKMYGYYDPSTLEVASDLATMLVERGELTEAENVYKDILEGYKSTPESDTELLLSFRGDLASVLRSQGKFEEAESLCTELLMVYREKLWHSTDGALLARETLADILTCQKRDDEAKLQHQLLSQLRRGRLLEDCDEARKLIHHGKYKEAEYICRQALTACEKHLGAKHRYSLLVLRELSVALVHQQKLGEAESIFREALDLHEKLSDFTEAMTIDFMADLANVVEIQGKLEEAETMRSRMREALEIREAREAREFMAEEETREARDIIDAQEAQVAQEATAMPKGLSTKVRNMSHRFVSESDLEDVIFESRRRTAGLAE